MIMIWQQWEGTATTVANPSISPPSPLNTIWLKAIFVSRPFWRNAILAQGHHMVVQVVVMAMVARMVIVMNDVGDGDDGDDEHDRH